MPLIEVKEIYTVIGMMSGTSCDGVDAALIKTDGQNIIELEQGLTLPYPDQLHSQLKSAIHNNDGDLLQLENDITQHHAKAIEALLKQSGKSAAEIDLVGFHGQTIKHAPHQQITQQIGNLPLLAHLCGIDVVGDFRRKDVAANGQGAPLVPVFLQALAQGHELPVMFLNIGGIANVCYITDADPIAFDVGPGIGALDDWVSSMTEQSYDKDGEISAKGKADMQVVSKVLAQPFFTADVPKSIDRMDFTASLVQHLGLEDGAATLVEISAQAIAKSIDSMSSAPNKLVVSGGGRHNRTLLRRISELCTANVVNADDLGIDGDMLEAHCFGYLAVRMIKKLPITFPSTTTVRQAQLGGVFCPA